MQNHSLMSPITALYTRKPKMALRKRIGYNICPGKYNTEQTSLNTVQCKKICKSLKLGKQNW